MKIAAQALLIAIASLIGACQSNPYPYEVGPVGFAFHAQIFWDDQYPLQIVAGDFDNDGLDDLWIIRDGENGSILNCCWGSASPQPSLDYYQSLDVDEACAGDFDGDGFLDLILFGEDSGIRIAHYSTMGGRSLRPIGIHTGIDEYAQDLRVRDSNQDGVDDIFVHNSAGRRSILVSWEGGGQPVLLEQPWDHEWEQGYGSEAVPKLGRVTETIDAIGDLDLDGVQDVLIHASINTASGSSRQSDGVNEIPWEWLGLHALLLDDSGSKLQIKQKLQVLEYMASPFDAVMLDFDGDGDPDIAVKSPRVGESGGVVLIKNELPKHQEANP